MNKDNSKDLPEDAKLAAERLDVLAEAFILTLSNGKRGVSLHRISEGKVAIIVNLDDSFKDSVDGLVKITLSVIGHTFKEWLKND